MEEIWNNFINSIDFNYIEILIWLFFTYSFAGWVMESFGGIFVTKKFVNRGFLIGPLCPVYGIGVVIITIVLGKYSNDIFALFVLSTVLCGVLEYLTSYIMEKLFNARWWDYTNRKFNINGRICLQNLCLFGIAGSAILCIANPFFINLYMKIPDFQRHLITGIVLGLFAVDFIISFIIISSFKGATYDKMDNTEEISSKVKDKAEDIIIKAESNAIHSIRKLTVKGMKFQRKIRYRRSKLFNSKNYSLRELLIKMNEDKNNIKNRIIDEKAKFDEQIKLKKINFENKQKQIVENKIKKTRDEIEEFQKVSKQKVEETIKNIKISSEEFSKQVKDKFSSQSILKHRLINAFPNMIVRKPKNEKKDKLNKKNN